MPSPEVVLAAVLRSQHGACTIEQARNAGFTTDQIKRHVATGRWQRPMRGILAEASAPATWERATMIALISRPDGAAALLTAARISGPKRVQGLLDTTMHQHLTTVRSVDLAIERAVALPSRSSQALLAALEVWRPDIRPGSAAEARLLRLLVEWGFDEPDRQIPVVDRSGVVVARLATGWIRRRLALDYDPIEWHGPARWATDEARHALVASLGWELLHVDADDLRPASGLQRRLEAAWRRSEPIVDESWDRR